MRKLKGIIAITLMASLLAACSMLKFVSMKDIMSIEPGMSKQQVIDKLGEPSLRFFEDGYEELGFNLGHVNSPNYYTITHIRFENNKVVSMASVQMPVINTAVQPVTDGK